jgi:hypothetical protein
MTKNGRWALKFERCANCGTDKTKHQGLGLCERCYLRKVYHENPARKEYLNRKAREWTKAHPKRTAEIARKASKKWREKFRARDPEGLKEHDRENWRRNYAKNKLKINAKRKAKRQICHK